MVKIGCFSLLIGGKKKCKGDNRFPEYFHNTVGKGTQLHLKLEHPIRACVSPTPDSSKCKRKVASDANSLVVEAVEAAYEDGDEYEEHLPSIKRELSHSDLQAQMDVATRDMSLKEKMVLDESDGQTNDGYESRSERDAEVGDELIQSGHVSDPGSVQDKFWATPLLKRSCSNLEMRDMIRKKLFPRNSRYFADLHSLLNGVPDEGVQGSPASVMTCCSADRVVLKKHSSSQVLPSRSRRLWWKLFLWSHRNLHKPQMVKRRVSTIKFKPEQKGGYCSDTLEPSRDRYSSKLNSAGPFKRELRMKDKQKLYNFHGNVSGLWPQNQWVAFCPGSSSLTRVGEWVNSLDDQTPTLPIHEETGYDNIVFPPSPEIRKSQSRSTSHGIGRHTLDISEEDLHANSVIQSLNSSSAVAHIAGVNLKVIPTMSLFSSLRSLNLSCNFIVRITPGSLPKGLQILNLSRNKIVIVEGLRELTRLRVLDLSYNRITRIGHGFSNCTLIKELYLAGNKISNMEGLHRLLKIAILDLSFNKITTTKALGQLVANYNSLLALNLLGNPIHNIGEEHLRKVASGLLPQLAYLNKQPVKPQRALELATNIVAKAAQGNSGWSPGRKVQKPIPPRGSPCSGYNRSTLDGGRKNKHRSNSRSDLVSHRPRFSLASNFSNYSPLLGTQR